VALQLVGHEAGHGHGPAAGARLSLDPPTDVGDGR
jgi:hypothetical protein